MIEFTTLIIIGLLPKPGDSDLSIVPQSKQIGDAGFSLKSVLQVKLLAPCPSGFELCFS